MGPVMDINNIYQYTETFNLINTTIKKNNIAINMEIIWRHSILSQSEVVCTVVILEEQGGTPFSLCRERLRARRRALTFRKSALGRAASAHVVERTSGEGFKLDLNTDMKENYLMSLTPRPHVKIINFYLHSSVF